MAEESSTNNFLIKVDKLRKKTYAQSIFLKPDDIIVAFNNEFYTFGEKRLVEELKTSKEDH